MASSRRAVPRPPDAIQRPLRAHAAVWVPFTPTVQSRARSASQRTCFAYCASARLASNTVRCQVAPLRKPSRAGSAPPGAPSARGAHISRESAAGGATARAAPRSARARRRPGTRRGSQGAFPRAYLSLRGAAGVAPCRGRLGGQVHSSKHVHPGRPGQPPRSLARERTAVVSKYGQQQ